MLSLLGTVMDFFFHELLFVIQRTVLLFFFPTQVLNLVQSYVTLRVPLYVSYVFHSPVGTGGWQHFDLQSELRLTFVYDTAILWKDGIGSPPQAELQGKLLTWSDYYTFLFLGSTIFIINLQKINAFGVIQCVFCDIFWQVRCTQPACVSMSRDVWW